MKTDIEQFAIIMKALAINAGVDLTEDVLKLYRAALKGFSIEQISSAVKGVLLTWRYNRMPPLAVIIDYIDGPPVKIEDKALVEANKIIEHLNFNGARTHPRLDDPITKYLMTRRWPYQNWVANVLESELKWWVKEFCEAYRAHDGDPEKLIEGPAEIRKLASELFESV